MEAADVFVLHEVEPGQVTNDIRLFFRHSFSELKRCRRELGDWPSEEQVNLLCERARDCSSMRSPLSGSLTRRTTVPRSSSIASYGRRRVAYLRGRPSSKLAQYSTRSTRQLSRRRIAVTMQKTIPESGLFWVLLSLLQTLSPSTIAALLGFELEEVLPLLSSLSSLLILQDDIDHPVRPFHKSFPDFIVDPTRCTDPRFRVYPPDQHAELLFGCLQTMNRELKRNICKLPDGVINSEVIDLRERTNENIGQALEYACRSWYKHLVGTIPAHIMPILRRFLEEKFLFWLEALSVLGAAKEAVLALEATAKCELVEVCRIPLLVHSKNSLGLEPGTIDPRPCQRLLTFHNHILRGHQPVRTAYISFSAPPILPNLDHMQAIQTIHPSPGKGRTRATVLVGPNCSHLVQ